MSEGPINDYLSLMHKKGYQLINACQYFKGRKLHINNDNKCRDNYLILSFKKCSNPRIFFYKDFLAGGKMMEDIETELNDYTVKKQEEGYELFDLVTNKKYCVSIDGLIHCSVANIGSFFMKEAKRDLL